MLAKILVRFDDICPTMNFKRFNEALEMMSVNNVKPLLGVIPDCQDPDLQIDHYNSEFWNFVRNLQEEGCSIAMHGYQHVFTSKCHGILEKRPESEFAGLPYDIQYDKLKKGRDLLLDKGIATDIFFAPAHSFDDTTVKALSDLGFKYISDGKSCKPYKRHNIIMLPCRASGCPKIGKSSMYTAVFHTHEWDKPDKYYDYKSFIDLINEHSHQIVDFRTYSDVPPFNYIVQVVSEKLYVFYFYYIKSILLRLYKTLYNK